MGSKQLLPSEYKLAASLEELKVKIKKWKWGTCPCRSCKTFKPNLGFVTLKELNFADGLTK